jgi:hypothetical protein
MELNLGFVPEGNQLEMLLQQGWQLGAVVAGRGKEPKRLD